MTNRNPQRSGTTFSRSTKTAAAVLSGFGWIGMSDTVAAQSFTPATTAAQAMRPLGSPSAVDAFDRDRSSAVASPIRQVAMQSGSFPLPPDMGGAPSNGAPAFVPPPATVIPGGSAFPGTEGNGAGVPTNGGMGVPPNGMRQSAPPSAFAPNLQSPPSQIPTPTPPPSSRQLPSGVSAVPGAASRDPQLDYQPMMAPQLANGGFSTMADCRLITPPSTYSSLSPLGNGCGCDSAVMPAAYAGVYNPPPAQIAAPAAMPPAVPGTLVPTTLPPNIPSAADAAPVGSLITFGQEQFPVQVGQGLWGQPVAYVPGQSIRNWLRYFSF